LIVEDDAELAATIAQGLRQQAIVADTALDGSHALEKVSMNAYDVVVLDRDLPGVHGDDVCGRIVQQRSGPRVLMLTAAEGLDDRVVGLGLGADDYLTKPFDFPELVARIHAVGRRPSRGAPPILRADDLTFDVARRRVRRGAHEVRLTAKEYRVLEVLMRAEGGVVSAEELLERAWGEDIDPFTATVRVTVANLRARLGDPSVIETIIGAGYRMMNSEG
jgi:two-component system response regulator VanR